MKQLWFFVCACAILTLGCNEIVPGTCYPNPAGGAGGGGSVPSTSVVTSTGAGDFPAYPESGPLAAGDADGDAYQLCVDDDPCVCQASGWRRYSPKLFKFAAIIPDNGKGPSGGWQEAPVELGVNRIQYTPFFYIERWKCPQMTFGMPLRNIMQGIISAQQAAVFSANLASRIADELFAQDANMPQGIYCFKLKDRLQKEIGGVVSGATVQSP